MGSQKVSVFPTPEGIIAAQAVADGILSDEQIGESLKRSRQWVTRLRRNPLFMARVQQIVDETAAALKAKGIAERQARIDDSVDLHNRLRLVIEERAEDDEWANVPGWKSGLLIHNVKAVGMMKTDVFEVDTGLIAAINNNKKQIAQEVGQWSEKKELTGKDGGPIKGEFTWSDLVALAAEDEA